MIFAVFGGGIVTSFPTEKNAEYLYTVNRDLGFVCVCANAMPCEKKMQFPGNDQHNQATWFCQVSSQLGLSHVQMNYYMLY